METKQPLVTICIPADQKFTIAVTAVAVGAFAVTSTALLVAALTSGNMTNSNTAKADQTKKAESALERHSSRLTSGFKRLSLDPSFSSSPVNIKLTDKVRWAVSKYGAMIMVYELGNSGKLADREMVLSIFTRRLSHANRNHPSYSTREIVQWVAKRWNPNKDRNLTQVQRRTYTERSCGKTCRVNNNMAITGILSGKLNTEVGLAVWKGMYTDFAHLDAPPSYYARLEKKKFFRASKQLKNRVWVGKDKQYFKQGKYTQQY